MARRVDKNLSYPWAVAVIASVGVGLAYLSRMPSIWLDEASSIALARLPYERLLSILAEREANMGLYYVLLKAWSTLGDGLLVLRLLSLLLAAAAVVCTYHLAALLFDRRVALVASVLLALNGMFVAFATEVRGYMLALVLVLAASYWFARCVLRPDRAAFVAYAVVASVALYAHLFAVFVIVSHGVSLVWLPRGERRLREFVVAFAAIALATSPITLFALTNGGQIGWIGSTTPADLAAAAVVVAGGLLAARARDAIHYVLGGGLVLLYAGLSAIAARSIHRYRRPWSVAFSLTCLFLTPAVVLAISLVGQPVWHYRYFVVVLPFAVILVARGLQTLPRAPAAVAGAAVCALSLASNLLCFDACPREDWAGAAAFVVREARPGDGIAFYAPEVRTAFDYYAGTRGPDVLYPSKEWISPDYEEAAALPDRARVRDLISDRPRLWLVLSHDDIEGDERGRLLERWVEGAWGPPREARAFDAVRVLLFEPSTVP